MFSQGGSLPYIPKTYPTHPEYTLYTREEGLVSIYRGLSPALVRQAVYGTLKFGLYYSR